MVSDAQIAGVGTDEPGWGQGVLRLSVLATRTPEQLGTAAQVVAAAVRSTAQAADADPPRLADRAIA